MSIITLYGTKGGTGRTTSAAALALGFLQIGKYVDVVDVTQDEPWLTSWVEKTQARRHPNYRLAATTISDPCKLAGVLQDATNDPDQIVIVDTAKYVTAARTIALDLADIIVVPFRHFLDAETAVQLAAAQIPRDQQMVGLSLSGRDKLSAKVRHWMPVLDTEVVWDDRLDLFGEDASSVMADAMRVVSHEPPTHADISRSLTNLATEVQKRLDDKLGDWGDAFKPKVLNTLNASLRDVA